MESTAGFYDALAKQYHLIFDDWDAAMARQSQVLDGLLRAELGDGALKVLDCACGIGTQAIGLAKRGHSVTGSDLSRAAIERARMEAERREVRIPFVVSDMTTLAEIEGAEFDVVAAFDNALPHLTVEGIRAAGRAIHGKLRRGGLLMATIRDYDELIVRRPSVQPPMFQGREGNRRIVHQVWDWDGDRYVVHLYITVETPDGWEAHHFAGVYRAVKRAEVTMALEDAGFERVRWIMPGEGGVKLPLVMARAG